MVTMKQGLGDASMKRPIAWQAVGLVVIAVLLAGGLIYAVTMSTSVSQSATQPAADAAQEYGVSTDNIQLLIGGIPQPFKQGTVLPVVGDLQGQLTLRTAEAHFLRNFDLLLYQETPDSPFDKADVQVAGRMPDMAHGDFRLLALPMGNGHYSVELPCGMNGQWQFDIQVGAEGRQGTISLLVDILE